MNAKTRKILITLGVLAVLATSIFIGYGIFEKSVFGMQMRSIVNKKSPEEIKQVSDIRDQMNKIKANTGYDALKPPETRKELKELVEKYQYIVKNSKNPDEANEYLAALLGVKNPDLVKPLCKYAQNGAKMDNNQPGFSEYFKSKLQVSAIYALGNIKDKKSSGCLEDLLSENQMLSCSASVSLGRIGAIESLDAMIINMEKSDYCSSAGIAYFGEKGLKAVLDKLNDPSLSEDQKAELKVKFSSITDQEAKPLLKQLFKSSDTDLSSNSGLSLINMVNEEDIDYLIEGLNKNEFDKSNVKYAIAGLSKIGDSKAVPIIEKIFYESAKGSVDWKYSFIALANLQRDLFFPVLVKYIKDENADVRKVAIGGLQYCNSNNAISLLLTIININSSEMESNEDRNAAILALRNMNSNEAMNAGKLLVDSKNENISVRGITIIESNANNNNSLKPIAHEILISIFENDHRARLKISALNSLYRLFGKDAKPIIEQYVNDQEIGQDAKSILNEMKRREIIQ